jgi:hypothetical protein
MLTLFAIPKPLVGEAAEPQRNAFRSWQQLGERVNVILLGSEAGVAEAAADFGFEHLPSIETNEFGTPLLNSAFELAQRQARDEIVGYANADLIFYPDLLEAVQAVSARAKRFLLVGQCYDHAVDAELDEAGLSALRRRDDGVLRTKRQIDYFVFPRGSVKDVPPFAVGRPAWDAWMIWQARRNRVKVVDLTPSTFVVHQPHGYTHVVTPTGKRSDGPEAVANRSLLRFGQRFSIDDATYRLEGGRLIANRTNLRRRIKTELLLHDVTVPTLRLYTRIRQVRVIR